MPFPAFMVAGAIGLAVVGGGTVAVVASTSGQSAVVERVVDGDTFDATVDGRSLRIRLLNVDTPETKDPNRPVECLGPEASDRLATLLPAGSTVTLDGDVEATDRYDRRLAGVTNAQGVFVNAQLAREGLGVPMLVGENDRFHDEVVAANDEARRARVGLYAESVACTLPARTQQVETTAATSSTYAWSPEQADQLADQADATVGEAVALLTVLDSPPTVRTALGLADEAMLRSRAQAAHDRATTNRDSARARAASMREQAAAAQRAQEDADRRAAEQRRADEQARAQAARDAERAEARRRAVVDTPSSPSTPSAGRGSGSSSAAGGAYPGYTGPRCYAPGGRTWRPC